MARQVSEAHFLSTADTCVRGPSWAPCHGRWGKDATLACLPHEDTGGRAGKGTACSQGRGGVSGGALSLWASSHSFPMSRVRLGVSCVELYEGGVSPPAPLSRRLVCKCIMDGSRRGQSPVLVTSPQTHRSGEGPVQEGTWRRSVWVQRGGVQRSSSPGPPLCFSAALRGALGRGPRGSVGVPPSLFGKVGLRFRKPRGRARRLSLQAPAHSMGAWRAVPCPSGPQGTRASASLHVSPDLAVLMVSPATREGRNLSQPTVAQKLASGVTRVARGPLSADRAQGTPLPDGSTARLSF